MLIGETWHWPRIKGIDDYPRTEYLATCTCKWNHLWRRQTLDIAQSDWEDHVEEEHTKESKP